MPARGHTQSAEARQRIAEAQRKYWADVRAGKRRKIGAGCKGKTLGRKLSRNHVAKMRTAMLAKGEEHSSKRPDVRQTLSQRYGGHAHRQTEPEALLHNALDKRSWRYVGSGVLRDGRVNPHYHLRKQLPVSADLVCLTAKTLVFVDGCYWHECPQHGTGAFPDKRSKDNELRERTRQCGWNVVSIWEHEVRTDAKEVAQLIEKGAKNGRSRGDTRKKRSR